MIDLEKNFIMSKIRSNLDLLPDDYIYLPEAERHQLVIEKFYPGAASLTANEICVYPEFDSLHDFQLHVAIKRCLNYPDKSKVIGVKKEELEEFFGGDT